MDGRVRIISKDKTTRTLFKGGLSFVAEGAGILFKSFDLCNETHWHDYILGGNVGTEEIVVYIETPLFTSKTIYQRRFAIMLTLVIVAVVDFYMNRMNTVSIQMAVLSRKMRI